MTDELTIDSNIKINYANSSRDSVYIMPYRLNEEEKEIALTILDGAELEMFNQIMNSHDVGSSMLVIAGLRSLTESLINKICSRENLPIEELDVNGKMKKIGLMRKYESIKNLIKEAENQKLLYNIIVIANKSLHELKSIIQRKGSARYIRNFIKILKEETFKNLNN